MPMYNHVRSVHFSANAKADATARCAIVYEQYIGWLTMSEILRRQLSHTGFVLNRAQRQRRDLEHFDECGVVKMPLLYFGGQP